MDDFDTDWYNGVLNQNATKSFINSISEQPSFDLNKFYMISPSIVKLRIDKVLHSL
ncbi:MAG: hypothetical protein NTZ60_01990 [Campylobacterales bacterium]|nr:hypothetical protein [Campylobacterales bacterium]